MSDRPTIEEIVRSNVETKLETWHVVYRDKDTEPPYFEVFRCKAEDSEHAKEQCENAYPTANILRIVEIDGSQDAVDE